MKLGVMGLGSWSNEQGDRSIALGTWGWEHGDKNRELGT